MDELILESLTAGWRAFAGHPRAAGHVVHTPDVMPAQLLARTRQGARSALRASMRLLPPDPWELSGTVAGIEMPVPSAIFLKGPPCRRLDGVADSILTARPGLLVVCVR